MTDNSGLLLAYERLRLELDAKTKDYNELKKIYTDYMDMVQTLKVTRVTPREKDVLEIPDKYGFVRVDLFDPISQQTYHYKQNFYPNEMEKVPLSILLERVIYNIMTTMMAQRKEKADAKD